MVIGHQSIKKTKGSGWECACAEARQAQEPGTRMSRKRKNRTQSIGRAWEADADTEAV